MKFKKINFPEVLNQAIVPDDIEINLPAKSDLAKDQQHFLLYLPWHDDFLKYVPDQFKDFFVKSLPLLGVRTTDVHTAISLGFLDNLINQFDQPINRRVVALSLILHDSGWSKLSESEVAASLGVKGLKLTESALEPKEKHALEGEKLARKILTSNTFLPPLSFQEIELICKSILYHDRPEEVAGADQKLPIEVQILVDLDHLWSFTHHNFWQDTVRKGVEPMEYWTNLKNDLNSYFVTIPGKNLAKQMLDERLLELKEWEKEVYAASHLIS